MSKASRSPARVVGIVAISAVAGACIGTIGAVMCTPIGAPFGFMGGAVIGLLVSPILLFALIRKPLPLACLLVAAPSLMAVVLGGIAQNPGVCLLSVVVFVGMAAVCGLVLQDRPQTVAPERCAKCGYDVGSLAQCPECGMVMGSGLQPDTGARRQARLGIAFAILLLAVIPVLGGSGWAAYQRHRHRTTAELIEQMGDNDMEIQWESRHALEAQGAQPLIRALRHPKAGVRMNAAWALEDLRDPAARDELTRLLNDPDRYVRERAQRALNAIGGPSNTGTPKP